MKKLLGSDITLDALKWQARRWKAGGILLANAVAAGIDPKDIDCDVNPQGKPDGAVSGKRKSTCLISPFIYTSFQIARMSTKLLLTELCY